jgi:N-acetylglucosamine kinase-like BadF-type ATPase
VDTYYIGIDGGGSKTLAIIVDAQGNECGRGQAGSSNHTGVGLERAVSNIYHAVKQASLTLQEQANPSVHFHKAWLGLAGVDRPEDYTMLMAHLAPLADSVHLTNDAELLLSALENTVGIALIAGTGSIALGRNAQGQTARAGGWGHILGDEGSGYDIGLQCLKAVAHAADGRGQQTLLREQVLEEWQLTNADGIIGQVYTNPDKAKIARLSALVFHAVRQGDAVASAIIQRAASELAAHVKTVSAKLNYAPEQGIALALGGGLLLGEADYQRQVLEHVRQQQAVEIVVPVEQPALSAARAIIRLS